MVKFERIFLAMALWCLLGCDNSKTIWTMQAESQDGKWLATALSVEHTGPRNNDLETKVYVGPTDASEKPTEILGFFHDPTQISKSIDLQMTWLSPTRLEVTYAKNPKMYLQLDKYRGIEISVSDRSKKLAP